MKTDAPGPFQCETYLKSWAMGFRHGSTLEHTRNCPFCRPLVHGGTEDCPLPAPQSAQASRREKARGRRRFLAAAAAGALALFGGGRFVHSYLSPPTAAPLVVAISNVDARLDLIYQTQGRVGIATAFFRAGPEEARRILDWIARKRHWSLLDIMTSALEAKDPEVQTHALVILMHRVPPAKLKPFMRDLSGIQRRTQDEDVRLYLEDLVGDIEGS